MAARMAQLQAEAAHSACELTAARESAAAMQAASEEAGEASEEAQAEGETLAALTRALCKKLMESQDAVRCLQDEVDRIKPPEFVDTEKPMPGRSKRRVVQTDQEYLLNVLTLRPWRACDVTKALERAGLLNTIFNTRQVQKSGHSSRNHVRD